MDTNFEQKVRERAYEIWMSAGMTDGLAHEHWLIAEQAVANETGAPVSVAKSAAKSAAKTTPAAKKTAAKAAATKKVAKAKPATKAKH